MNLSLNKPFILNLYKPADITSYDVIRKWKPRLKAFGKVGHFGTLDPFAEGVLMLGVAGGQRLNDYIHKFFPKTYLAKGFLGKEYDTGDRTGELIQTDDSQYPIEVISKFEKDFIEGLLRKEFLGKYMQAPHKFSAAKFQGKALHQWAREGVEIKKEPVEREVIALEVVKFEFPQLWIRFTVSSGTYIRTLFYDCAKALGTIGYLEGLVRERVGGCTIENAQDIENENLQPLDIDQVLPFGRVFLAEKESRLYANGVKLREDQILNIEESRFRGHFWVHSFEKHILGLAEIKDGQLISNVNFSF